MWILIQKAQCIFRHNIQAFTIQSAVGWILLTLTQFPLILPEAFSGSSLTQKWNVGVHARQFPPPPLMQHNTPPQNVTVFPVSLLARKFFALGSCVSPDSWLAKTCHLGSHSVCFVWCWEHCRWLLPSHTRTKSCGCDKSADERPSLQGSRWHTILLKNKHRPPRLVQIHRGVTNSVWARVPEHARCNLHDSLHSVHFLKSADFIPLE